MSAPRGTRALAVVERAYRGAVEQQYAHVLWLALSLHHRMGGMGVLLRGPAVLYARRGQAAPALDVGRARLGSLPRYEAAVRDLLAAGAPVYVDAASRRAAGLDEAALLDGVEDVERERVAAVFAAYDRIWYL